jgi:hypothetical protein
MQLFKSKYVLVVADPWIQEGYSCLCLPILGTALNAVECEDNTTVYNLIIPILFFDIIVMWGTRPINDEDDGNGNQ